MKFKMSLDRETKGTVVYREIDERGQPIENNRDAQCGTIYFQKSSEVGKSKPADITVEVSW